MSIADNRCIKHILIKIISGLSEGAFTIMFHKLRHFFGRILMNLIYLNQYEREDSLLYSDKEEILVPNLNQTL